MLIMGKVNLFVVFFCHFTVTIFYGIGAEFRERYLKMHHKMDLNTDIGFMEVRKYRIIKQSAKYP